MVFPSFHVLHVFLPFFMFSHPGWQDGAICRTLSLSGGLKNFMMVVCLMEKVIDGVFAEKASWWWCVSWKRPHSSKSSARIKMGPHANLAGALRQWYSSSWSSWYPYNHELHDIKIIPIIMIVVVVSHSGGCTLMVTSSESSNIIEITHLAHSLP